jgi:hypothetical protein
MTLDERGKSPGSSDRTGAVGIASPTKAEKAQGRHDGADELTCRLLDADCEAIQKAASVFSL